MPTVFELFGYRFFFYSNENNEPMHIHVDKGGAKAKYWISGIAEVYSYGFKARERRDIKKLVIENADKIIEHWNNFFK
jgi:hypothetical protein